MEIVFWVTAVIGALVVLGAIVAGGVELGVRGAIRWGLAAIAFVLLVVLSGAAYGGDEGKGPLLIGIWVAAILLLSIYLAQASKALEDRANLTRTQVDEDRQRIETLQSKILRRDERISRLTSCLKDAAGHSNDLLREIERLDRLSLYSVSEQRELLSHESLHGLESSHASLRGNLVEGLSHVAINDRVDRQAHPGPVLKTAFEHHIGANKLRILGLPDPEAPCPYCGDGQFLVQPREENRWDHSTAYWLCSRCLDLYTGGLSKERGPVPETEFEGHIEENRLVVLGEPELDRNCASCGEPGVVRVKPSEGSTSSGDDIDAYTICPACLNPSE